MGKEKPFNFKMETELYDRLREYAYTGKESMATVVRKAIEEKLAIMDGVYRIEITDAKLYVTLKGLCGERGKSMTDIIEEAIDKLVEKDNKK